MKKTFFAAAFAVVLFGCLPIDPDRLHDKDSAAMKLRDSSLVNAVPPPPPDASGNNVLPPAGQDSAEVLTFAEVMPEFQGGAGTFQSYLGQNIHYPQAEKEAGHQGTVYISFTVEKNGSISAVRVVKDVAGAPGLSKEAIRVISGMPKWKPGTMNGKQVRVNVTQPVKFRLR